MYCLDSDVLIEHLKGDPGLKEFVSVNPCCTTAINAQEILVGTVPGSRARESALDLLGRLEIVGYDAVAVEQAVELMQAHRKDGESIGIFDQMIAGICLANDLVLVTRNLKHFSKVTGLAVERR